MARSYNGWYASPNLKIRKLIVAGESFAPGILDNDDVYDVLQYVAEQMHARVEPVVRNDWHQADDWGFNYRPSTGSQKQLSCHASATAIDYNATRHPYGKRGTFSRKQEREIRKILAEVDGVVRWGGDFRNKGDEMHFEINASAAKVKAAANKLRAPKKPLLEVAQEVLMGWWGNGAVRKAKLTSAGYNYDKVQAKVVALLNKRLSVEQIAKQVIAGKWGNGNDRKKRLIAAGYNYAEVQVKVVELLDTKKASEPELIGWKSAHLSMQFSDSDKQQREDVKKLFSLGYVYITGTEAGPGNKVLRKALREEGEAAGYRVHIGSSSWVAVSKKIAPKPFITKGFEKVVDHTEGEGRHSNRGITWVTFNSPGAGTVTIGSTHYLAKARNPNSPNHKLNERFGPALTKFAKEKGRGKKLVFYGGDQNLVDRNMDTFFGAPFTSSWDELRRWPGTGHGNIDVMASFNNDGRVSVKGARRFTDKQKFFHTDHFLIQTNWIIESI